MSNSIIEETFKAVLDSAPAEYQEAVHAAVEAFCKETFEIQDDATNYFNIILAGTGAFTLQPPRIFLNPLAAHCARCAAEVFKGIIVTGHFKTSQSGSNQNRPL